MSTFSEFLTGGFTNTDFVSVTKGVVDALIIPYFGVVASLVLFFGSMRRPQHILVLVVGAWSLWTALERLYCAPWGEQMALTRYTGVPIVGSGLHWFRVRMMPLEVDEAFVFSVYFAAFGGVVRLVCGSTWWTFHAILEMTKGRPVTTAEGVSTAVSFAFNFWRTAWDVVCAVVKCSVLFWVWPVRVCIGYVVSVFVPNDDVARNAAWLSSACGDRLTLSEQDHLRRMGAVPPWVKYHWWFSPNSAEAQYMHGSATKWGARALFADVAARHEDAADMFDGVDVIVEGLIKEDKMLLSYTNQRPNLAGYMVQGKAQSLDQLLSKAVAVPSASVPKIVSLLNLDPDKTATIHYGHKERFFVVMDHNGNHKVLTNAVEKPARPASSASGMYEKYRDVFAKPSPLGGSARAVGIENGVTGGVYRFLGDTDYDSKGRFPVAGSAAEAAMAAGAAGWFREWDGKKFETFSDKKSFVTELAKVTLHGIPAVSMRSFQRLLVVVGSPHGDYKQSFEPAPGVAWMPDGFAYGDVKDEIARVKMHSYDRTYLGDYVCYFSPKKAGGDLDGRSYKAVLTVSECVVAASTFGIDLNGDGVDDDAYTSLRGCSSIRVGGIDAVITAEGVLQVGFNDVERLYRKMVLEGATHSLVDIDGGKITHPPILGPAPKAKQPKVPKSVAEFKDAAKKADPELNGGMAKKKFSKKAKDIVPEAVVNAKSVPIEPIRTFKLRQAFKTTDKDLLFEASCSLIANDIVLLPFDCPWVAAVAKETSDDRLEAFDVASMDEAEMCVDGEWVAIGKPYMTKEGFYASKVRAFSGVKKVSCVGVTENETITMFKSDGKLCVGKILGREVLTVKTPWSAFKVDVILHDATTQGGDCGSLATSRGGTFMGVHAGTKLSTPGRNFFVAGRGF